MARDEDKEDQREMDAFFGCDRNYIILTNSGKPVFSQHGDMYTLSSVYATLYAMLSTPVAPARAGRKEPPKAGQLH